LIASRSSRTLSLRDSFFIKGFLEVPFCLVLRIISWAPGRQSAGGSSSNPA
jgi:hypothetical protein